jgi:hypothetical protein
MPLWVIGKLKTPRALKGINTRALGIQWRHNKTACMDQHIMKEWLNTFDQYVSFLVRDILLIMDNSHAHRIAVHDCNLLPNIRVEWVPMRPTRLPPTLDPGVIYSFKTHYRRQWLEYMLQSYERGETPIKTMTIHQAIRWIVQAWQNNVTSTTIKNCFRKSVVLSGKQEKEAPMALDEIYTQVQWQGEIHDAMTLAEFISLAIEEIQATDIRDQKEDYDEEDEDDDAPEPKPISTEAALRAVRLLLEYTERLDCVIPHPARWREHIMGLERLLLQRRETERSQSELGP